MAPVPRRGILTDDAPMTTTLLRPHSPVPAHAEPTAEPAVGSARPAGRDPYLDLLRAGPRQQLAALRRAAGDPAYVGQWVRWHIRRLFKSG